MRIRNRRSARYRYTRWIGTGAVSPGIRFWMGKPPNHRSDHPDPAASERCHDFDIGGIGNYSPQRPSRKRSIPERDEREASFQRGPRSERSHGHKQGYKAFLPGSLAPHRIPFWKGKCCIGGCRENIPPSPPLRDCKTWLLSCHLSHPRTGSFLMNRKANSQEISEKVHKSPESFFKICVIRERK